jgi:hypothetical protein
MRRVLTPIVEGHGDVEAVPALLRRILSERHAIHDLQVDRPIRVPRNKLVKPDERLRWVRIAFRQERCSAVVVIMDADDDCAAELAVTLLDVARTVEGGRPVYVVFAVKEYEAWLLAGMGSYTALPPEGPESARDAKSWIEKNLSGKYAETVDQVKLTNKLDLELAANRSRSFRKLLDTMSDLAYCLGQTSPSI